MLVVFYVGLNRDDTTTAAGPSLTLSFLQQLWTLQSGGTNRDDETTRAINKVNL